MSIVLSEWESVMKISVSHGNAHQRVTSAEGDFNYQVTIMTHLWIKVRKGREGHIIDHLN